uniref:Uncharacterized protein n=1 Tax=Arundo donax TaxID=35708 RepID=A0A0A9FDP9_ARUDO
MLVTSFHKIKKELETAALLLLLLHIRFRCLRLVIFLCLDYIFKVTSTGIT